MIYVSGVARNHVTSKSMIVVRAGNIECIPFETWINMHREAVLRVFIFFDQV